MTSSSSGMGASLLSDSQVMSSSAEDLLENMTTQAENFPDMTVEEFLLKLRDEASARIMALAQDQVKRLREEFERERDELLGNIENKRARAGEEKAKAAATVKIPFSVLKIRVMDAEHDKEMTIRVGGPKAAFARVGRSQNKHYTEKGISLHWDLEVSTSHGQFKLVDGQVVFEDLGSTNHSYVTSLSTRAQTELRAGQTATIHKGDILQVGACKLAILDITEEV